MKCIVCGHSAWTRLFPAKDRMFDIAGVFHEHRCLWCGLVRLSPKLSVSQISKYYPPTSYYAYTKTSNYDFFRNLRSYLITHLYHPTVLSRVIELFVRVPAMPRIRSGRLLDVGCGSGETMSLLKAVGWRVYGLDISRNAIRFARTQGLANARVGSYEDMKQYPDHYFDVIRMYHVIEHLPNPLLALRLAKKKLKKNGELIVGTPNVESFVAKIAGQYWYNLDCPRHLYLFTPKTLGLLMEKAGFSNRTTDFCSAGGIVGSLQYITQELFSHHVNLINRLWIVMFFYPLEWLLDTCRQGDVFVTYGT